MRRRSRFDEAVRFRYRSAQSRENEAEMVSSTQFDVIVVGGVVAGWIQWQAEEEPDYRHASGD